MRRDVVGKGVPGTEAIGNVHALLPALKFAEIQQLESAEMLEILVLLVVVIEIQVAHLVETTGELAPCTLPLDISGLPADSSQTGTGADASAPMISSNRASDLARALGSGLCLGVLGLFGQVEEMGALHAVPVAIGYVVETNTVGMIGCIAAITQQKDVFSLGRIADGAGVGFLLFLLRVLTKPLLDIELGNLLLVLDRVR